MTYVKNTYNKIENYKLQIEDYHNLFPIKYVQQFELNQRGSPIRRMIVPNHLFLVDLRTNIKKPITYQDLLVNDVYIADKQYYLMQIFQVEKDIEKAKYIYNN